jgi:hypothetical protein
MQAVFWIETKQIIQLQRDVGITASNQHPKRFHGCSYYKVVTAFAEAWCGVQVMVV